MAISIQNFQIGQNNIPKSLFHSNLKKKSKSDFHINLLS